MELTQALGIDPKHLKTAEALVTQRFRELGILYQHLLYPLVMGLPNDRDLVIVETGVNVGISTYFILKALEDREAAGLTGGVLYSCDPKFKSQVDVESKLSSNKDGWPHFFGDNTRLFKRWKFLPLKSRDAFAQMPESWDMFVHDSDHSLENMTMELDEALVRCEPGSPIVIDDHAGDINVTGLHNAFERWVLKNRWSYDDAMRVDYEKTAFFRLPEPGVGTSPSFNEVVAPPALGRAPSEPPAVAEQVAVAAALGVAEPVAAQDDEEGFEEDDEEGFNDDELDELEENDNEE